MSENDRTEIEDHVLRLTRNSIARLIMQRPGLSLNQLFHDYEIIPITDAAGELQEMRFRLTDRFWREALN